MKILYFNKSSLLFFFAIPILLNTLALLVDHPYFRHADSKFYIKIYLIIILGGVALTLLFNYVVRVRSTRFEGANEKDTYFLYYLVPIGWLVFLVPSYFLLEDYNPKPKPLPESEQVSEPNDDSETLGQRFQSLVGRD